MTIKEIAQLAQVSSAAVSRYMNGGYVSEEKKERIRAVIEETGYRPSVQARTLRTKRACLIGVIVPKINSESISRITEGIGQILAKSGYQMLLTITNNNSSKELEYVDLFEAYPVDGIILVGTVLTRAHKKKLKECKVPIVVIGQYTKETSCVYHDDYGAAKASWKRSIREGCLYRSDKRRQSSRSCKRRWISGGTERSRKRTGGILPSQSKIHHGIRI